MNYSDLQKFSKIYVDEYDAGDDSYFKAIDNLSGKAIEKLTEADIEMAIVPYFNVWMKALRVSWRDPIIIKHIHKGITESAPYFKLFNDKKLEEISIDEFLTDIKKIFDTFQNISIESNKPREKNSKLCAVGAAKLMHVLNPSVFPLWDRRIREAYLGYWTEPLLAYN